MNCKEFCIYIQNEINGKEYDEYIHTFSEYREYLEKRLEKNQYDVEAACQLCAVLLELRENDDTCRKPIKNILEAKEKQLSHNDLIRLYTNLAGVYLYSKGNFAILRKVVKLDGKYPEPYEALGMLYMDRKYFNAAEKLFSKALKLHRCDIYAYNLATALFANGKFSQALKMLEGLEKTDDFCVNYAIALCLYKLSDTAKAEETAHRLVDNPEADGICLADLFFACGNYSEAAEMYERESTNTVREYWTKPYLCCLKKMGSRKLEGQYNRMREIIKGDIQSFANEPIEGDFTEKCRDAIVSNIKSELSEFEDFYKNGCREFIPEMEILYKDVCLLIDCPRHKMPV